MYTKFHKNLLIISLLIIGGVLLFGINVRAQTCVPACDPFTEDCRQDPETGNYDCLPKSAAGCPGGCPTGQECQWDSVDGSWACELITTGGSVPSGCEYCAGTADEAACIDDCLNGTGTNSGGGIGGTNPGGGIGNTNPGGGVGAPIGNATIPNWLGVSSISQLITNVADFIINYIALPLAVLMIILAGFRFATAQGNEEKLKKARSNFIWTIIGVGIVLAAKILIVYIRELLTGTSGGTLTTMLNRIKGTLNLVIALLFALVTVYFIWGVIQYIGAAGNEEKLKEGRRHMIWGIIGMSIMGAAWGIVLIIKNYITGS